MRNDSITQRRDPLSVQFGSAGWEQVRQQGDNVVSQQQLKIDADLRARCINVEERGYPLQMG